MAAEMVPTTNSVRTGYVGNSYPPIREMRRAAFDLWLERIKADAAADARLGYVCGQCWLADGKHEPGIHSADDA